MTRLRHLFPILAVSLSSCSHAYDLKAVVIEGRLAFVVDPASRHDASCINQIDVIASGGVRAKPAPGDDVSRMSYGTVWHQRLDHDCIDAFPIFYGQRLKGKPSPSKQAISIVSAKPLKIGVVYEVTTTTGATGYGGGAFKILPDHTVINVPPPPLVDGNNLVEPVLGNGS